MERLYSIGASGREASVVPVAEPETVDATSSKSGLVDAFGRRLTYLRVSVTDRCNLRCTYCLPEDAEFPFGDRDFLSVDELEELVGGLVELGIRKVRLTGGEPLVRKDIVEIVTRLRGLDGLEDLSLSTNGTELARLAGPLARAGLDRINVSLDTLDPERFSSITRRGDLGRVLEGLEAAAAAGLAPIKVNAVLMAGGGERDVLDLVGLAREAALDVRFIEMMPTGTNGHVQATEALSAETAKGWIEKRWGPMTPVVEGDPRRRTGPARHYRLEGFAGRVGFITPLSHTFCEDCNRLRLTARGELRLCLFADRVHPLRHWLARGDGGVALRAGIRSALMEKPEEHHLLEGDFGNLASFMQIGG